MNRSCNLAVLSFCYLAAGCAPLAYFNSEDIQIREGPNGTKQLVGSVQVLFIGMTNDPTLGSAALLCVTNQFAPLIICAQMTPQVRFSAGWGDVDDRSPSGLAYLEQGESYVFAVPVTAGKESWRVPVLWQRRSLSQFEMLLNRLSGQLLVPFGVPNIHRDPWIPFSHVAYSPELPK